MEMQLDCELHLVLWLLKLLDGFVDLLSEGQAKVCTVGVVHYKANLEKQNFLALNRNMKYLININLN